jgi:phosphoglycolate phosphatase
LQPVVFAVHAWGIDGATRRDLPPVAMQRYSAFNSGPIVHERVVIIGDTPHDVDCALHNGCRALGVATGAYSLDELAGSGAHRVMANLEQTNDVLDWLLQSAGMIDR